MKQITAISFVFFGFVTFGQAEASDEDHLDGDKNLNANYNDSLIHDKISTRDTSVIETIISTEVTTNSTIKTKKCSH